MTSITSLTPVKAAVLEGCRRHEERSYLPLTASRVWWNAPEPFQGGPGTCTAHLRALADARYLSHGNEPGSYHLTPKGKEAPWPLPDLH